MHGVVWPNIRTLNYWNRKKEKPALPCWSSSSVPLHHICFLPFPWATQFLHLSYQMKWLKQEGAVCRAHCCTILQIERKCSEIDGLRGETILYDQTLRGLCRMPLRICSSDDAEVAHTVGCSWRRYFLCHTSCVGSMFCSPTQRTFFTSCVCIIIKFPFCIPAWLSSSRAGTLTRPLSHNLRGFVPTLTRIILNSVECFPERLPQICVFSPIFWFSY